MFSYFPCTIETSQSFKKEMCFPFGVVYLASKNGTFTIITYPRFKALLAFVLNEKHEIIVAILRQYPFGTDKAIQMLW